MSVQEPDTVRLVPSTMGTVLPGPQVLQHLPVRDEDAESLLARQDGVLAVPALPQQGRPL